MAIDAFLQFDSPGDAAPPIEGETQDADMRKKLKPWPFDISAWNFGISQDVNIGSSTGGAGAGKVNFNPFKITKVIDKSSPAFFKTCCVGGHFEKVTLYCRKSGVDKTKSGGIYLVFEFAMVFVSNISWSHSDPAPTEEIQFDYGAMRITYRVQTPKGALETTPHEGSWSRVLNNGEFALLQGSVFPKVSTT
jgi:type VI secretion system secreted protein Hcp